MPFDFVFRKWFLRKGLWRIRYVGWGERHFVFNDKSLSLNEVSGFGLHARPTKITDFGSQDAAARNALPLQLTDLLKPPVLGGSRSGGIVAMQGGGG